MTSLLTLSDLVHLFHRGEYVEVEAGARRLLAGSHGEDAEALKILGSAQIRLRKLDAAKVSLEQALLLTPSDPELLNNYGVLLKQRGERDDAKLIFLRAVRANPSLSATYKNLSNLLLDASELKFANICWSIATERGEDDVQVVARIAEAYYEVGAYSSCVSLLSAYDLRKLDPSAQLTLANAYKFLHRYDEAATGYERILVADRENWQALSNLAGVYRERGRLVESVSLFRRAIEKRPDSAVLYTNLGVALKDLGYFDEADSAHRKALELDRNFWVGHSNLLFSLNYSPAVTPAMYFSSAIDFGSQLAAVVSPLSTSPQRIATMRPRKIGFITGDLWAHPVCYFLYSLVSNISERDLECSVYVTKTHSDGFTRRISKHLSKIKSLVGLTDEAAARIIAQDEVDVLIDLAGHTAGNRLPVFQYRPAPLQITWLGYFASTGLQEMDYIVGDKVVTPKSEQGHFVEKIYQMPEVYFCYTVPVDAVPVGDLPLLTNNYVTFGCFNNLSKIGPEVKALWAQILKQVPTSKLFLKYKQLVDPAVREALEKDFVARGIPPERLILEGSSHLNDYYRSYNRVDICLDPFPYPGGTTTIDALWMGVPTVMLAGDRFVSRNGETIARAVGLTSWVAKTKEDYVALAVKWAGKPKELAVLRKGLRAKLEASPLMDGKRFAADFQDALNAMWDERMATLHEPGVVTHTSAAVAAKPAAKQQPTSEVKPQTKPAPAAKPNAKAKRP